MASALEKLLAEHAEIEKRLADPDVHNDAAEARGLGRRYAELAAVVELAREMEHTNGELETARELATEDASFRSEVADLEAAIAEQRQRLRALLVPADPDDSRDAILEVKAGAGGQESALFAGDLLRMYLRYAERRGWKTEILDANPSDLGGYRDISVAVKYRGQVPPGQPGVYGRLRFEGGVHRVQRVPVTESAGRIHTSAAGVLVMPEAEDVDVEIDANDLRIDVFRSSGPGGQSVNTTDSAVRITHMPTGVVVSCQNEKSQLQNKESALRILRARLLTIAREKAESEKSAARASQVRTLDRSDKVRTYNFPENRIADHRVGYKAHNLEQVLDGELDDVLDALVAADLAERLAESPDEGG
ncbi:peptide chain release factor 1 [Pseudofrankia asymbiotica]|uniref:Peptide chain release factor 1 n=1 Tax=Pseudofrankia asymbiotica TaxID=1834516 RepID=A0A1V2IA40_9ACTN|nr:peptide chain release factor 1 [Pseudofrankia asymbiotica]ONH28128.1 peptide chain release factor 1 [Pseudofrankia asymbiotica]